MTARRGAALLFVLIAMVSMGTLAAAVSAQVRVALRAVDNRVRLLEADWALEGCQAIARAQIDSWRLAQAERSAGSTAPYSPPFEAADLLARLNCRTRIVALPTVPATVDANGADSLALVGALSRLDLSSARVDSLVSAILDWRDADDDPRSGGAEASSYPRSSPQFPSNRAFATTDELALVRGMRDLPYDEALSVSGLPLPRRTAARGSGQRWQAEPARAWIVQSRRSVRADGFEAVMEEIVEKRGAGSAVTVVRRWVE